MNLQVYIARILMLSVIFLSVLSSNLWADQSVGLMMDGYEKDCNVKRAVDGKSVPCEYRMELFKDDVIAKKPDTKAIKIQWMAPPYTKAEQQDKTQMKIVSNLPENKQKIAGLAQEFLIFLGLKKTNQGTNYMVSRTLTNDRMVSPGYAVSGIMGHPIHFAWVGKGQAYILYDSSGKVIYRAQLDGRSSLSILPDKIGMKSGESYSWEVEGLVFTKKPVVKMLTLVIENQVVQGIQEIDGRSNIPRTERVLLKAGYVQLLSDMFPDEIDLYWLSAVFAKEVEDSQTKDLILEKIQLHKKQADK